MTFGVHSMCGIASVVPQTVPNQIWDVFRCQNELCMKLPPHSLNLNPVYQTNFTSAAVDRFNRQIKAVLF